ncbi:MAG: DUF3795 domain-containing protein [Anaerolineales bacterium]|nr:DUF3795 domain-containing protein [Anaerolineales bacterium]
MELTDKIIANCGILCSDCSAYLATQSGDKSELEKVAAQWVEEYNLEGATITDVTCDGCLGKEGRKGAHCSQCDIRACGLSRGVVNCAHCPDYACEKLNNFFVIAPGTQDVLDQIRASM